MRKDDARDNPGKGKSAAITPERYREMRALFEAALGVPEDSRAEWLQTACKGDTELVAQVKQLLIADFGAGEDKDIPQIFPSSMDASDIPSMDGRCLDHYQVIREIGRGGMGIVYLARRADDLFSKQVALKVLRPERKDPEFDRRFRKEREIVARLEHPNIARLLDGGTTAEGLPYSVMEYVEGLPVDVYCDENRLNVTARLKIFQTICGAVQYAHQNLVVHRDLKPSNILVTADGTVKLLDFGIAKLMAADLQETQTNPSLGVHVMTPAYASPEQTSGQPINTSSDVYSLGVILYELLTGRSPYRTRGRLLHEVVQAICEQVPPKPSDIVLQPVAETGRFDHAALPSPEQLGEIREGKPIKLQRRLAGELDNIVLMALRKEPQRRYGSVEQLNSDIDRHLAGLPILAQKDTVRYRMGKFVKRHRFGVASASLTALLLCAAIVGTSWQSRIAQQERARAEHEAADAKFQSERAERQTKEAEVQRRRAEQEASRATEQLRVAEEQTRVAKEKEREARQERDKATKRAQQLHATSAALLALSPDPAGSENKTIKKTVGVDPLQVMEKLLLEGYDDPSLRLDITTQRNLRRKFEGTKLDGACGTPADWSFTNCQNYLMSLEKQSGASAFIANIRSRRPKIQDFAELSQAVDAGSYVGKRIRFSAMLKSKDVESAAGLFVRIVGKDSQTLLGKKSDPILVGTRDWAKSTIDFDVPGNSSELTIGLLLQGGGSIWAEILYFGDAVGPTAPVELKVPVNLGFEGVQ